MAFSLTDDGTLDTVVRCDDCGEEVRFTYEGSPAVLQSDTADDLEARAEAAYEEFVRECIDDAENSHVCPTGNSDEELSDGE